MAFKASIQSGARLTSTAMSEANQPLTKIARFMDGLLQTEGPTVKGVGWRNRENQRLRFAQLVRALELGAEPFTVNDLGCGLADLYGFIKDLGLPMRGYRGYDVSEKMLVAARERIGDDGEVVQAERVTETADYSFACGIFNTKLDATDEEWLAYMKSVLANLDEHSERAFAFNSLTTYVEYREDHHFYADPAELFRFCKQEISPRVVLLHDYPLWEWTIAVRASE
jgi:SAM-dependent methyltransferase